MPLNLIKVYNDLLDFSGMNEAQRNRSLKGVFDRDITNNRQFCFRGIPIYPTPKEDGETAMGNLFNHLTRKTVDYATNHREFDSARSQRLHWIKYHVEEKKKDGMLIFSASSNKGIRTYIYDKVEKYVIVLEPLRKRCGYYLLTAYHLDGKDAARDKIERMYRRKLPTLV